MNAVSLPSYSKVIAADDIWFVHSLLIFLSLLLQENAFLSVNSQLFVFLNKQTNNVVKMRNIQILVSCCIFFFFWLTLMRCLLGSDMTKPCKSLSASGQAVRQRWHRALTVQQRNLGKITRTDILDSGNLASL